MSDSLQRRVVVNKNMSDLERRESSSTMCHETWSSCSCTRMQMVACAPYKHCWGAHVLAVVHAAHAEAPQLAASLGPAWPPDSHEHNQTEHGARATTYFPRSTFRFSLSYFRRPRPARHYNNNLGHAARSDQLGWTPMCPLSPCKLRAKGTETLGSVEHRVLVGLHTGTIAKWGGRWASTSGGAPENPTFDLGLGGWVEHTRERVSSSRTHLLLIPNDEIVTRDEGGTQVVQPPVGMFGG
jgi:hypothetical protein